MAALNVTNESFSLHPDTLTNASVSKHGVSEYYQDFAEFPVVRYSFIIAFCIVIFFTVFGNLMVAFIILRQNNMRSSVNYLICNLAISDILVGAFVAPGKLMELTAPAKLQFFSDALCTTLGFVQSANIFSTILTLLLISAERFFVIVLPLRARRFDSTLRTKVYIGLTWILAALISAPNLWGSSKVDLNVTSEYGDLHVSICLPTGYAKIHLAFQYVYFMSIFVGLYLLPMTVITVTCVFIVRVLNKASELVNKDHDLAAQRQAETRRKVSMMMITVCVGFGVCWSPYFWVTFYTENFYNFFDDGNFVFTMLVINFMGFLNSCINPVIYIMNDRFREEYKRLLRALCLPLCTKVKKLDDWSQSSFTSTALSRMSTTVSLRGAETSPRASSGAQLQKRL